MVKRVAAAGPVEGPWVLPEGWRWEALGSLGTWFGGGTPSKARPDFWTDGTIPWVSPKDMKRPLIDSSEDSITASAVAGSSAKMVSAGSVLCVMRSGILRHTFPVAVNTVDVTLNQDMRALSPRSDVNPRYLAYYLQFTGQTVLHTASKAGTTVNSIEAGRLDRHPVPLISIDQQQAIVDRIDGLFADIDDGDAALTRARDDLATWRKALLKAAVTGELTADWRAANPPTETGTDLLARVFADRRARWEAEPKNRGKRYREPEEPDLEVMPNTPESWTWTTADALTSGDRNDIVIGPFGSDLKTTDYREEGVPLIFVRHIRAMNFSGLRPQFVSVDKAARLESHVARSGDVLVTKMGDPPGDAALYPQGLADGIVTADCIRWRPSAVLPARFLVEWINSQAGRRWIASKTKGVAQQKITLALFRSMPVPVPPPAEVEAILGELGRLRHSVAELAEAEADAAATSPTLRQSILAAAFRGELA